MTIALGMLAGDAMIVAADTEVSIENYMKTGQGKIRYTIDAKTNDKEWGVFAITGSGQTAYLDAVQQEATKVFLNHPNATMSELEGYLKRFLKEFYRDHVIPFSAYAQDRPDFWLIIAVERGIYRQMWVSNQNTLRRVNSHAAVGIGEMQAMISLNRLAALPQDVETAQLVSTYVIFDVKERIPGCGKDTDVIYIQRGAVFGLHRLQVRQLEELFREHAVLEAIVIHRMLGSERKFAEMDRITQTIENLRTKAWNIIHLNNPAPVPSAVHEDT